MSGNTMVTTVLSQAIVFQLNFRCVELLYAITLLSGLLQRSLLFAAAARFDSCLTGFSEQKKVRCFILNFCNTGNNISLIPKIILS